MGPLTEGTLGWQTDYSNYTYEEFSQYYVTPWSAVHMLNHVDSPSEGGGWPVYMGLTKEQLKKD